MKFLKLVPIIFILFGIFPDKSFVYAEGNNPNNYKALTNDNKTLSIANIEFFLTKGDNSITEGDFDGAKDSYEKARQLAKQIARFYADLNQSFKGIDARIPREMQKKGNDTLQILAEANARLASLYIRKEEPEVAVPLLIEIIRILTPNTPQGKEAYESLLKLGFVETSYKG